MTTLGLQKVHCFLTCVCFGLLRTISYQEGIAEIQTENFQTTLHRFAVANRAQSSTNTFSMT